MRDASLCLGHAKRHNNSLRRGSQNFHDCAPPPPQDLQQDLWSRVSAHLSKTHEDLVHQGRASASLVPMKQSMNKLSTDPRAVNHRYTITTLHKRGMRDQYNPPGSSVALEGGLHGDQVRSQWEAVQKLVCAVSGEGETEWCVLWKCCGCITLHAFWQNKARIAPFQLMYSICCTEYKN